MQAGEMAGRNRNSGGSDKEVVTSRALGAWEVPISHAVLHGNSLYVSGLLGQDPKTKNLVEGGLAAEARQMLDNLGLILKYV